MDEAEKLKEAVRELLKYREGVLPRKGYLRDTDGSRLALARLAALIEDE